MKVVYKDALFLIKKYDTTDFLQNMQEIVSNCNRVIASYEIVDETDEMLYANDDYDFERDKEALSDLFTNNFLDNIKYNVYILYIENAPVGYAIYSQKDNTNSYVLEFIHMSKDYTSMGYGTFLLKQSATNLKNTEKAEEIMSTINKNNAKSLYLHESFIAKNGLKYYINDYGDRFVWHMDISKLNEKSETSDLTL